jgi:hypothetical protein
MEPFTELQARRLEILLATCLDVSLGTLWCIREDLWGEALPRYRVNRRRLWHPGLSLRVAPLTSLADHVPTLYGSSGDRGPVVAWGLTRERGPKHPTSFGQLIFPARISAKEIAGRRKLAREDRGTGPWYRHRRVSANAWKPRLNDSEMEQLEAWATGWNLI